MKYIIKKPNQTWTTIIICVLAIFVLNSCQKEQLSSTEDLRVQSTPVKVTELLQQGKLVSVLDLPESNLSSNQLTNRGATSRNVDGVNVPEEILEAVKEYREEMRRMINPDDFECDPTFLNEYIGSLIKDFTEEELNLLFEFGSFIPIVEAAIYDDNKDKDFYGYEGRFTSSIRYTFVNLKSFWDIPIDIQLSDMHGTVFQDVPLVAQIIQQFFVSFDDEGNPFPIPTAAAIGFAQELSDLFGSDKFDNYNHPMFTFNALAFPGSPEFGIPKKIVMGDGVMEVYSDLGLGSVAERFILAHEYGHHLHFAKDIFGDNSPEAGRFLELLADTYASYYASHGQGLFLHPLLLNRYIKTSSSVGDCAFDSPGHHGTPNQRGRAADLGGKLAKQVGLFDPKYSSDEILDLFIAAFPELIQPDAE